MRLRDKTKLKKKTNINCTQNSMSMLRRKKLTTSHCHQITTKLYKLTFTIQKKDLLPVLDETHNQSKKKFRKRNIQKKLPIFENQYFLNE